MKDLGVVGEGKVVGEPRRAEHGLVAQVDLARLGELALPLVPAPCHRRVERTLQLFVEVGHLLVGLVDPVS